MKLKVKYLRGGEADEWTSAESIVLRRWDFTALGLAGLFSLAALIAWKTAPAVLNAPDSGGFVLWFLLCCAYPMLGLAGLIGWVAGASFMQGFHEISAAHPVLMLWSMDFLSVLVIWGIGRLCAFRRESVPALRVAGNFLLIVIGWGVFQLMLFGVAQLREVHLSSSNCTEQIQKK